MSTQVQIAPPGARLGQLPFDQDRGRQAMWCLIITESMLFVAMFGAYYYLGNNKDRWAQDTPPPMWLAFILLAILLSSSVILHWGEKRLREHRFGLARIALWVTVLFGVGFLALQGFEYYSDWSQLAPYNDSYSSIFYALTTLHAAHVCVGLLLLCYVGVLPRYDQTTRTPRRPYETIAMYWHFVDAVWVFIVTFLYVIPHFQRLYHAG